MRYNKNYKFTRIIIERVVIMVMDNNLKSALKSENFFEEYQTGIINLFDSFDSTIVLEFDADEIIDVRDKEWRTSRQLWRKPIQQ